MLAHTDKDYTAKGFNQRVKKNFFSDINKGYKVVRDLPAYPAHVTKFIKNKYFKIFSYIGAICLSLILLKHKYDIVMNPIVFDIMCPISVTYTIARLVLVFYAIREGTIYLIYGKFLDKNSTCYPAASAAAGNMF